MPLFKNTYITKELTPGLPEAVASMNKDIPIEHIAVLSPCRACILDRMGREGQTCFPLHLPAWFHVYTIYPSIRQMDGEKKHQHAMPYRDSFKFKGCTCSGLYQSPVFLIYKYVQNKVRKIYNFCSLNNCWKVLIQEYINICTIKLLIYVCVYIYIFF
uniref:Uncharacterized protein n=1 Tax=Sphaerodactylus townsendi TaxID=933632 RepID=A0ACB8F2U8_9SAUR